MKNIILKSILFFCILVLSSCESEVSKTNVNLDNLKSFETSELKLNLINKSPNIYWDYLNPTTNIIGFSSAKTGPLENHKYSERIKIGKLESEIDVFMNEKILQNNNGMLRNSSDDRTEIFGKHIKLSLRKKESSSLRIVSGDVKMYVPKKINISKPLVDKADKQFPYCWYKDFVLEWNTDPKNEEGLLVVLEYFGANVSPEQHTEPAVINVDFIPEDNGRAVLSNEIWDNIPHGAIAYLSLLRGNVELKEIDDEIVKIYAETHAELPLIVLKDMSKVVFEE